LRPWLRVSAFELAGLRCVLLRACSRSGKGRTARVVPQDSVLLADIGTTVTNRPQALRITPWGAWAAVIVAQRLERHAELAGQKEIAWAS
jgi:hypothetical protein